MAVDLHVEAGQEYMRPSAVARMMDVSVDTVLDMAHKGELEGVKFGNQVRIRLASLMTYLETHRIGKQVVTDSSTLTVVIEDGEEQA